MCYDDDARAPLPPVIAGPVTMSDLVLESADGTRFAAVLAQSAKPGPRLLFLPDIRGISPFYADMAKRFAEAGITTLVIDYYGRTAGVEPRTEFDRPFHTGQWRRETVLEDIRAAYDHIGQGAFIGGSCIGGATALHAATSDMDFAGVIAFYPWKGAVGHAEELPDDFVSAIRVPVLGLFGDADTAVPPPVAHAFEKHLTAAGTPHEIVIYPGQPHGFFEEGNSDAAADAWLRLLAFTGIHSGHKND